MTASAGAQTLLPVVTSTRIEGTRLKAPDAEKEFLQSVTHAAIAEVRAAELAIKQASDPDVKAYAQRVLDGHRQAHSMLQVVARDRGMKLPDAPTGRQATRLKRLQAARGIDFDRRYIDGFGADTHDEAIGQSRRVLSQGEHAATKQLASQLLPQLEANLVQAKELQSKLESHAGRNRMGGKPGSNLPPPAASAVGR